MINNALGSLTVKLNIDNSAFRQGMEEAKTAMKDFQKSGTNSLMTSMDRAGRNLSLYLTAPIVGFATAASNAFMEFEYNLAKVEGLIRVSGDLVEDWGKQILESASYLAKSPEELSEALYFITSGGIRDTVDSMETLEYAAKAAAAGLGETTQVADLITSAMNAYGRETMSAQKATDILMTTVREGKAYPKDLAQSIGYALPIAAMLGVTFEEVGAAIAAMTRTGTKAHTAAIQLRQIMMQLVKPTEKAKQIAAELGYTYNELRAILTEEDGLLKVMMLLKDHAYQSADGIEKLGRLFGNVRALSGVLDILGPNLESNLVIWENLKNSAGATDIAFDVVSNTLKYKWNSAMVEAKVVMTEVGRAFKKVILPVLETLITTWKGLYKAIRALPSNFKTIIISLAGLLAVIGPLLLSLSTAVKIFSFMKIGLTLLKPAVVGITLVFKGLATTIGITSVALLGWFALIGVAIGGAVYAWSQYNKSVQEAKDNKVIKVEIEGKEDVEMTRKAYEELNEQKQEIIKNSYKATEPLVKELTELKRNIKYITSLNQENRHRIKIINELKLKYPDIIGNIKAEDAENKELLKGYRKITAELKEQIKLKFLNTHKENNFNKAVEAQMKIFTLKEKEFEIKEKLRKLEEQFQKTPPDEMVEENIQMGLLTKTIRYPKQTQLQKQAKELEQSLANVRIELMNQQGLWKYFINQVDLAEKAFDELVQQILKGKEASTKIGEIVTIFGVNYKRTVDGWKEIGVAISNTNEELDENKTLYEQLTTEISELEKKIRDIILQNVKFGKSLDVTDLVVELEKLKQKKKEVDEAFKVFNITEAKDKFLQDMKEMEIAFNKNFEMLPYSKTTIQTEDGFVYKEDVEKDDEIQNVLDYYQELINQLKIKYETRKELLKGNTEELETLEKTYVQNTITLEEYKNQAIERINEKYSRKEESFHAVKKSELQKQIDSVVSSYQKLLDDVTKIYETEKEIYKKDKKELERIEKDYADAIVEINRRKYDEIELIRKEHEDKEKEQLQKRLDAVRQYTKDEYQLKYEEYLQYRNTLTEGYLEGEIEYKEYTEQLTLAWKKFINSVKEGNIEAETSTKKLLRKIERYWEQAFNNAVQSVADSTEAIALGIEDVWEATTKAILGFTDAIVQALFRIAAAYIIEKSAELGPWGLAAAAIGLGVLQGLWSSWVGWEKSKLEPPNDDLNSLYEYKDHSGGKGNTMYQGLATGGFVTKAGIFEVGEKGRELVHLPAGASVTPNHLLSENVGELNLKGVIRGRDLEIILDRTQAQSKRR